jgi:NADH-quinone oxidoreductase subunit M
MAGRSHANDHTRISTGALFILAGTVYQRTHTRDIAKMGGFWPKMPFMATVTVVFAMASLGLPGLGNFVAEFLTLLGSWQANKSLTVFAAIGLVGATAYSLRIIQKIFYGRETPSQRLFTDLSVREKLILIPMVIAIVWLGVFPQPILNTSQRVVKEGLEFPATPRPSPFIEKKSNPTAIYQEGGIYE